MKPSGSPHWLLVAAGLGLLSHIFVIFSSRETVKKGLKEKRDRNHRTMQPTDKILRDLQQEPIILKGQPGWMPLVNDLDMKTDDKKCCCFEVQDVNRFVIYQKAGNETQDRRYLAGSFTYMKELITMNDDKGFEVQYKLSNGPKPENQEDEKLFVPLTDDFMAVCNIDGSQLQTWIHLYVGEAEPRQGKIDAMSCLWKQMSCGRMSKRFEVKREMCEDKHGALITECKAKYDSKGIKKQAVVLPLAKSNSPLPPAQPPPPNEGEKKVTTSNSDDAKDATKTTSSKSMDAKKSVKDAQKPLSDEGKTANEKVDPGSTKDDKPKKTEQVDAGSTEATENVQSSSTENNNGDASRTDNPSVKEKGPKERPSDQGVANTTKVDPGATNDGDQTAKKNGNGNPERAEQGNPGSKEEKGNPKAT
eukprot:gnl/MRDRNA2_/MRDRNA2_34308_c0_seq1.p1 gnl/MRDRNA2_/MRDRNA2_34308_c0~~gnl/MRDRNA2_/MRDRNA2_34308_c0_seq1.p1  ORF type:complete len:418 (-),score=100.92 gnl/MRDRNA2_/MRDRNA2_34308_c0_seq1:50-1303(-)